MKNVEQSAASSSGSQQTLTHLVKPSSQTTKYNSRHPQQVSITDALVCFIAEDLVPLSIVDSTRFNKLLHTLDPKNQTPSRKHMSTVLLKRKYNSVKNKILKQLEGIESINLTVDLWSNRQMKSFLGHFILKD